MLELEGIFEIKPPSYYYICGIGSPERIMTEHLSAVGFQSGAQAGSSISQGKGVASCSPVIFSCVRGPTISYSQ